MIPFKGPVTKLALAGAAAAGAVGIHLQSEKLPPVPTLKETVRDDLPTIYTFLTENSHLNPHVVHQLNSLASSRRGALNIIGVVVPSTGVNGARKGDFSLESLNALASRNGIMFPLIPDKGCELAIKLRANKQDETFLVSPAGELIYRGSIDNASDGLKDQDTIPFLDRAIESLESGLPLSHRITRVEAPLLPGKHVEHVEPTFDRDVGPTIQQSCIACHRPDDVASKLPLTTAEQVSKAAHTVAIRLMDNSMPPFAAHSPYPLMNDPRLDVNQIWAFSRWAELNSPKGKGDYVLDPQKADLNLRMFEADAELWMMGSKEAEPFGVPHKDPLPYQHFEVEIPVPEGPVEKLVDGTVVKRIELPTQITEPKWVTATQVIPGNAAAIVHHAVVLKYEPKEMFFSEFGPARIHAIKHLKRKIPGLELTPDQYRISLLTYGEGFRNELKLMGSYTPTHTAIKFPAGSGFLLKPGDRLLFEMHYTPDVTIAPTDSEEPRYFDNTRITMKFADKIPADAAGRQIRTRAGAPEMTHIKIPAGEARTIVNTLEFFADAKLVALRPHMHLYGKEFRLVIERPGELPEVALMIPEWNYQWQMFYNFKEPVDLPAGTKVHSIYTWDNTTGKEPIYFNPGIRGEMGMSWITYTLPDASTAEDAEQKLSDALYDIQKDPNYSDPVLKRLFFNPEYNGVGPLERPPFKYVVPAEAASPEVKPELSQSDHSR